MGMALDALLDRLPRGTAYVSTRIVSDSALTGLLQDRGFTGVENRRLYTGLIAALRRRLKRGGEHGLHYAPLAAFTGAANAGRPTRVITRILRRNEDYAVIPDGSLQTYLDFCGFVARITAVRQFRLTQLTPVSF